MAKFNKKGKYLTAEMSFRYNPKTELIEVTTKDGELGKDGFLFTISPTSLPGRKVLETIASHADVKFLAKTASPNLPASPLYYTKETDFSDPERIPLGVGEDNTVLFWEPAKSPHLIITGRPGSGKTVAQNVIAYHLSQHPVSWEVYRVDTTFGTISHPGEKRPLRSSNLLEDLNKLLQDKINILRKRFKEMVNDDIFDFSKMPKEENPRIMIIIDEVAALTRFYHYDSKEDKQAKYILMKKLEKIAREGRLAGIHLCLNTQLPDRETVSPTLRQECSFYGTGQLNAMIANMLFWNDEATKINPRQKGMGYLSFRNHGKGGFIQGYWSDYGATSS